MKSLQTMQQYLFHKNFWLYVSHLKTKREINSTFLVRVYNSIDIISVTMCRNFSTEFGLTMYLCAPF